MLVPVDFWKLGSGTDFVSRQFRREFDDELYEYLLKFPLVLGISEHNIYVVHAGLVPDVPITEQKPGDIMNMVSSMLYYSKPRDIEFDHLNCFASETLTKMEHQQKKRKKVSLGLIFGMWRN